MAELANCTRCNKVFAKQFRDICQDCYKQEEKDFQTVYTYLKTCRNREATLQEVVEHTNVDEETVIKFIKEKRLRTSQFPKLAYPCSRCGRDILSGRICETCQDEMNLDLERHRINESFKQSNEEKDNPVYFSINQKK
ncbi:TIGR03826 family flagellar region protein [Virgibacillus halophilus]|uniref:Flagellar operon protein TIGR03826 n=1 Tax=Tigheibacillus halophilus TaxID=361280 RepID=A0ABU5C1R0_9BACI|nr:hypothetical protein [Virgibacillus halophilus]